MHSHININPLTNEYRKSPSTQMPALMKEIQSTMDKFEDRQSSKHAFRQQQKDKQRKKDEIHNPLRNKLNKLKTFACEYLEELKILALGMINRQIYFYATFHENGNLKV